MSHKSAPSTPSARSASILARIVSILSASISAGRSFCNFQKICGLPIAIRANRLSCLGQLLTNEQAGPISPEGCQQNGDVPKSPFNNRQLLPSVGRKTHSSIDVGLNRGSPWHPHSEPLQPEGPSAGKPFIINPLS